MTACTKIHCSTNIARIFRYTLGSKWLIRDVNYDNFQIDLAELDCLYGGNVAQLDDTLSSKINKVAAKNFKETKIKNKGGRQDKS